MVESERYTLAAVGDGVGMTVLSVVIMLVLAFAGEEAFSGDSVQLSASQSMVVVQATFFGFGWIAFAYTS